MNPISNERRYFDAWLKRTGKILAASGRLSQVALVLARDLGGSADDWRARLLGILDGQETPSLDLLMTIDGILAPPARAPGEGTGQGDLFHG